MGLSISKSIAADPSVVFERITDLRTAADHVEGITNIDVLTEGPIRAGTRFRETRIMFGKECTEEMEITQFDAPNSYTVEGESCGARMISRFDVQPDGIGTKVVMSMETRPQTWMAKIMSPVTKVLLTVMMKKCLEKDLEGIRASLENVA